jgi:hypothetical protein
MHSIVLFWFKTYELHCGKHRNRVGMVFAVRRHAGNLDLSRKDGLRSYALDNLVGVVGPVAARICLGRGRQLDPPNLAGGFGRFTSSVDYRATGGCLTLNSTER